ncbi:MAG: M3 family metallopeptidase, partial [Burkholderiales bacterium]|nr:M3 family metallopeptidase [Burkholderiales bacterium]
MIRTASSLLTRVALAVAAAYLPAAAGTQHVNPFLSASPLQFEYPQWDKISDADYEPALRMGMKQQDVEIKRIAESKAAPTFQNTIVAMERSGQLLNRVRTTFENQGDANSDDAINALREKIEPELAAHSDRIYMNKHLFQRVAALYEKRDALGLDPESKHLLWRYYTDFVRAGANLNDADKVALQKINAEMAALQTKFQIDVQKDGNLGSVIVDSRDELKGMSEGDIDAAAAAAKEHGQPGKYLIALQNTTIQPLETVLDNRALRQRIYEASISRGNHGGDFDNRGVVLKLVKLRAEKARLMGFPNYAAYVAADQMAHTPEAIGKMLSYIAAPALANAKRDAAEMQQIIDAEHGGFQLAPWDWQYYAAKLRSAKFNFDEEQVKPYFELNHVLQDGVFYAANQMYGLTFKERKDLPVYNPDVRVFEIFDADGKSMALIMLDYYARDNKNGGAWMNNYVDQSFLLGKKPVIANHLNIVKPKDGQPTLLTFDEVTTAFHEFGHALHGMFSHVEYPRFTGTTTPSDFVEYPSQFNEMWAAWPEVLKHYAKDYRTGAPLPDDLFKKVQAVQKFDQGFATTEYISAAMLDQSWHTLTPDNIPTDVVKFEADALKQNGMDYAPIPPR